MITDARLKHLSSPDYIKSEPGQIAAELVVARALVRDAWPVMHAHQTRHARKALNDHVSGFWRESHRNKAMASEDWLIRAKDFAPETSAEPAPYCATPGCLGEREPGTIRCYSHNLANAYAPNRDCKEGK
jgi:hypothetical protein